LPGGFLLPCTRRRPCQPSLLPVVVDFDLENSFVLRGNSLSRDGLLVKPTIRATTVAEKR
jgi:hypothetical protein